MKPGYFVSSMYKQSYKTGRMQKIRKITMMAILLLATFLLQAQDPNTKTGFDSTMRSSGRIYVVVAVMTTILLGLFIYLVRIDRKIKKMENQN
jgi:hypothetical protein